MGSFDLNRVQKPVLRTHLDWSADAFSSRRLPATCTALDRTSVMPNVTDIRCHQPLPRARRLTGPRRRCLPPTLEDPLHLGPDVFARLGAVGAGHDQLVVARVLVAHGGGDGERDRLRGESAPRRAPPHAPAAAGASVAGDRLGALARTAGIEPLDLAGHPLLELDVLGLSPHRLALPAPDSRLRVGQAFPLGALERLLLDQDPLPLVASA